MINRLSRKSWTVLIGILIGAGSAAADDSLKDIPRIDVHAHCGNPRNMERYVRISDSLRQEYGQRLVAWVDLNFRRNEDDSADEYLEAASTKYQRRFLPCLHSATKDGIKYTAQDLGAWQRRGVVGLKIWVGVSDAIDKPEHDPLFAEMVEIGMPGASIHIAQPYPTSWCEDHIEFWRAQNAWERVLDGHPNLVVVNAHMLDHFNSDEQLNYLDYMLATYENLHVDLAARFQQFGQMDRDKLRQFMIRHQDRILFGTDIGQVGDNPERFAAGYHRCFMLLESDGVVKGSFFGKDVERRGLALPRETLEKIYYRNAVKIYPAARDAMKALGYTG